MNGGGYDGYDRALIDRTGQSEGFDSIGARYGEVFPHKEGQLAAGHWLTSNLPTGSRVLDVGCGTGLPTAHQVDEAGHQVVGIDLSAIMLKLCRDHVPSGVFHRLDLADLESVALGPFDGITCFFTLLNLPREEIPYALRMLHGQLRPGGLLALSMVEADLNDYAIPFLGHSIRVSGYLREDLRQVVCDAGFEIAEEDVYAYAPASTEVPPEIQLFLHCRRRA